MLLAGILTLSFEVRPLEVIYFAQVANGLLLPVVGFFLLWAVNTPYLMGTAKNTAIQNALAMFVLLLITGLGIWSIFKIII